ncbi:MFS transporter TsgA [Dongshaea marina]|uniref:MFS transporter TsgA n=1 Tax=Dongshaea marina TaxID=2047966 RepID=UPI000D3E8218|nr:MFS transporter TsgA [Dongshaea marina]
MNNLNKIRLTWISYLCFALTGATVAVTGMVMAPVAQFFDIPLSSMSNTFTFLNVGILIALIFNAWLMELISIKRQLVFSFVLMVLCVLGLMFSHSLVMFSACMFILGILAGIATSVAATLITCLYDGTKRGAQMLFTDSFFSMASMILPVVTGFMLGKHIPWYWVYAVIGLFFVAIFLLTIPSDFPELGNKAAAKGEQPAHKEKWNLAVYILGLAAMFYILGQLVFISWVPQYVEQTFKLSVEQAGTVVGRFWMSYMIGMWIFSLVLRYTDLHKLLVGLSLLSVVFMFMFNHTAQAGHLGYLIFALGFVSSAIYTSLITLASQQIKTASPKLINGILTCGTVGCMLTFVVSSPVVKMFGPHSALVVANGLYAAVFVICVAVGFCSKHKQNARELAAAQ